MGEKNLAIDQEKLESMKKADANVKKMSDFTSPEVLYEELLACVRKYHPSADLSMIEKAYRIAKNAHEGQFRKSGEPYIIHPLCVAIILADLELDKETIVAGLLHLSLIHICKEGRASQDREDGGAEVGLPTLFCHRKDLVARKSVV